MLLLFRGIRCLKARVQFIFEWRDIQTQTQLKSTPATQCYSLGVARFLPQKWMTFFQSHRHQCTCYPHKLKLTTPISYSYPTPPKISLKFDFSLSGGAHLQVTTPN